MDDRFISCDDHLDLQYLPPDLWTTRLPAHLVDRGPRVEERDGRLMWVCDGVVWGGWAGTPAPAGPKRNYNAFDRVGADETERRPAVPELRLQDMDRDGVKAHVIFGPVTSMNIEDPGLRVACYRAYNDWLVEYCSVAPDRLIGVAMLPPLEPDEAAREVYRLADLGVKQANIQIAQAQPGLHSDVWEPLRNAFEETGVLMSWHIFVYQYVGPGEPEFGRPASIIGASTKKFVKQFLDPFVDLFSWGVLERHPNMRLVLAESGAGWVPWVVQEMDHRHILLWEARECWEYQEGGPLQLEMKPSDIFKRQVYLTFQDDHVAMHLLKFFGEDKILWASDYPHPDSVWPNSHQVVEEQMSHLSPEVRRKITHDNAARLYGLEIAEPAGAAR